MEKVPVTDNTKTTYNGVLGRLTHSLKDMSLQLALRYFRTFLYDEMGNTRQSIC